MTARRGRHRPRRARRRSWLNWALGWVVLAAVMVLGWPAQYGGHTGYTIVAGRSMSPTYQTGDLLLTRAQEHYRLGQVVVYQVPKGAPGAGYRVVHSLVGGSGEPGGPGWATKGDNNKRVDIWAPHDTDITGAAVYRIPGAGFVLRQFRSPLLYAALGALVVGRVLWPTGDDDDGDDDGDDDNNGDGAGGDAGRPLYDSGVIDLPAGEAKPIRGSGAALGGA